MKKYVYVWALLALTMSCSKNSPEEENPPPGINKAANLLATGASANDILSGDPFTTILIEAGYVENFQPTQQAMDEFMSFLMERTFKQQIILNYKMLPSPNETTLTLQEIADLEEENRTAYNSGDTLAIYIYFADAPSVDDNEEEAIVTLGAVYRNTSMVIYEKAVRDLAAQSPVVSNADVESATLNHEFGHLFGLVNLGTTEVNPHEDPDAENHCIVQGCLMRAELQFGGGMLSMLERRAAKGQSPPPDLDPECLLDLQANGGK